MRHGIIIGVSGVSLRVLTTHQCYHRIGRVASDKGRLPQAAVMGRGNVTPSRQGEYEDAAAHGRASEEIPVMNRSFVTDNLPRIMSR